MKRVQYEESATRKKVQHENDKHEKKCNKYKMKKVKHGKSATRKKVQH